VTSLVIPLYSRKKIMMTRSFDEEVTALVPASIDQSMVGKDDIVMELPLMPVSTSTSSSSLSSIPGNHRRVSLTANDTAPGESSTTQAAQTEVQHELQLQSAVKHQQSSHKKSARKSSQKVGRWTLDEKILFLYGLRKFGKGRWKKISVFLPDRYVRLSCSCTDVNGIGSAQSIVCLVGC
jgi:hypothetical protein